MKKKSILFLTNAYPDFDSSYRGNFIKEMAMRLQINGYRISVVTPKIYLPPTDTLNVPRCMYSEYNLGFLYSTYCKAPKGEKFPPWGLRIDTFRKFIIIILLQKVKG